MKNLKTVLWKSQKRIYVPASVNVLVPGHIHLIKKLKKRGRVFLGLLTSNAMSGYKKERMSYKDRKFILSELECMKDVLIVPQNTLSPEENVVKYSIDAIASGDGWEESESQIIKKHGLETINIDSGHKVHSSNI